VINKTALAIGAHPDDIEFCMAGTLLLLKKAGFQIHYLNVANGSCGSTNYGAAAMRRIRAREAQAAARRLGAIHHRPMVDDLEIVYSVKLLRSVAAVVRKVRPVILLTHSPQDYMEDHMATSRLAVTAAFARGMPNFETTPASSATDYEVTVYHALPHGLCDGLGERVIPGAFVNTSSVHDAKLEALAEHRSQQTWLGVSQKMNSFLLCMESMSRAVGRMSRKFKFAEGWRRHLHLGLCKAGTDPLRDALGRDYAVNEIYQQRSKPRA
jgi:LmbE family N-acetylglucosaminyl deacetylase